MNATNAANITAMEFVMAPIPAGALSAPHAKRMNGMAELMAEIHVRCSHSPGVNCARARHRNGSNTMAPSARRTSTRANGPKSDAATRMNKNDPPQIAPSSVSSTGVSHRAVPAATAGAGVIVPGRAVVSSDNDMRTILPGAIRRGDILSRCKQLARARSGQFALKSGHRDLGTAVEPSAGRPRYHPDLAIES